MMEITKQKNAKWSLGVLIVSFSFISFATSYTGLLKLTGVTQEDQVLQTFMGLLVAVLQFALVFSINALYLQDFFKKYWLKSVALLITYLMVMMMSVTFSFSFWYETFSVEAYAKRSFELQVNKVKNTLSEAENSFALMLESLVQLTDYSTTESTREKQFGGTCDPRVGSGEGVYTWLRAEDAKYTQSFSKDLEGLKAELSKEIIALSNYVNTFDPKGDVETFNQTINKNINRINQKYFKNPILTQLNSILKQRSGQSRQSIEVLNRRTNQMNVVSCMDLEFSMNARKVIRSLEGLHPIANVDLFDMSDTKKLFNRTTQVLAALVNPSYEIKEISEMHRPDDITYDDIKAVSAGFLIDILILLLGFVAKKPREHFISAKTVQDILEGKYPSKILNTLTPFLAEVNNNYLVAVPSESKDPKVSNLKTLILYLQEQKLVELYINGRKAERFDKYFSQFLMRTYPDSTFKVYRLDKKKFNQFILQNIELGETKYV